MIKSTRRKEIEDAYFNKGIPIQRIAAAQNLSENIVSKVLRGEV